jgi:plastocyanin
MRVPAPVTLAAASAMVLATTLAAAPSVAAAAGPLIVTADMPAAVPAGHTWAYNDFFPRHLNVVSGQTIGFAVEGFHTATLLPQGTTSASDLKHQGIGAADDDTTPNPNGTSHIAVNIPALMPTSTTCGTAASPCAFDGTSIVSSGAPLGGPPAGPFMVTVTAPAGTYEFHCRIHPKMTGKITVVASEQGATSPAQFTASVAKQVAGDKAAGLLAERRASDGAKHRNADGTTTWYITPGAQSGDGRVAILEFLPRHISIRPGDRVTWKIKENTEPHTVTFPGELHTDMLPLCEPSGGGGGADAPAVPTVVPPTGLQDFSCATGTGPFEVELDGGNGLRTITSPATVSDSGILGTSWWRQSFGLPASASLTSWSVRFTGAAKGTYTFVCQLHDGMAGTITVH